MPRDPVAVALARWGDPETLFAARESRAQHAFWLDAGPDAETGWSYLGEGEPEPDLDAVRGVVVGAPVQAGDWPAGPFRGGWVGWIGYEAGAVRAGAPIAEDPHAVPGECWLRVHRFLAFDHARRRVWAVAAADEVDEWARLSDERMSSTPAEVSWPDAAPTTAVGRHAPERYAALIEECRSAIREGDAYQLCLTTRFDVSASIDPTAAYGRLRQATPAHHGGFIRSGEVALLSASPEQFLTIEGGTIRTRPIKGTRPRGGDAITDEALAAELRASPKERAENVMIVDLMRNDLARVSEPGTIRVEALLEVESYAAVHQLVSTVAGTLRTDTTLGEVWDAAFPAGSMTGAPKLSAMTILHRLEGGARGVYSGCFGFLGEDGDIDLAMVIRSVIRHEGGAFVGAGGGITWGSDAEAEVAEVGIKARAPLASIGATLPPGW